MSVVDLDLDLLQPPDKTVRFHGVDYRLPGDVPITTITKALQIQNALDSAGEDTERQEELLTSLYGEIMQLFRDRNPEIEDLRLTINELSMVLGLIVGGVQQEKLQEAVVKELSDPAQPPSDGGAQEGEPSLDAADDPPPQVSAA